MYAPSSISKTLTDLLAAHKWAVVTSSTAVGADGTDEQTLLRQPFSGQGCSQRQCRGANAAPSQQQEGGQLFPAGVVMGWRQAPLAAMHKGGSGHGALRAPEMEG